ncbi:murein-DD-endopeptidase [Melaminivora alkalimesophila]|uniref:Murein-DD-endopeptidase n=2 Tax=Melaminivora alkalimesophila TaxID=1165852 RepID=A0A317RC03_9BURK|nr:serine hydrolase [Melaminivora alkalimesophila]PWW46421.1 murein-DD-endopeptidase [Melaminivora alkalimesophila]
MPLRPRIASRLARVLGLSVLAAALSVPTVHAAPRQKSPPAKTAKKAAAPAGAKRAAASARATPRKGATAATAHRARAAARSARAPLRAAAPAAPARLSFGQLAGLHKVSDPLDLKSSVALVLDQDTKEVLLSKNDRAVLPIASLTKLMTGLLISESQLPMDEPITITQDDVDTEKHSSSRLAVGSTLTRGELLHLALMSSENRAAHALGRTYPGGLAAFVERMNAKAKLLGMTDTRYVEPTGLSSQNQSSAHDLATLVNVAHADPLLRELSTSPGHEVAIGQRVLQYRNTNRLVQSPAWEIGLQKTGYISEAGRCLVMQAEVAGRKLIMVFLDSAGKFSRLGDAERVRSWVESLQTGGASVLHAGAAGAGLKP